MNMKSTEGKIEIQLNCAVFSDPMYPEDNESLGLFFEEANAEAFISETIEFYEKANPGNPYYHKCNRDYYKVVQIPLYASEDEIRAIVKDYNL